MANSPMISALLLNWEAWTHLRHPEVRAKRASKDERPGPSPFEAVASRGPLRGTERGWSLCHRLELFRHARRKICEHAVAAGALECDQALDHGALAIEPAVLRRRHDHRVLARDLVREGRHAERLLHSAQHVEIGH